MPRREISAGCVIYRQGTDGPEVALICPAGRQRWALPKGQLEKKESAENAAAREATEETGLEGSIVGKIDTIKYTYTAKWEDPPALVFKIVTFFLMKQTGGDTAHHDWEVQKVEWFRLDEAIRVASYKTEKDILRKAQQILAKDNH